MHQLGRLARVSAPLLALVALVVLPRAGYPATPREFVYVHSNANPNQLFGFELRADGTIPVLPGSPYQSGQPGSPGGGQSQTASVSEKKRLVFSGGANGISVFRINADGTLALVPGSPFGAANLFTVAALDVGTSTFVYGGESQAGEIHGFAVQADSTLVEVPGSPFAAGQFPDGLSASKGLLAVAHDSVPEVNCWRILANGALKPAAKSPVTLPTTEGNLLNTAFAPGKRFFYVPDLSGANRIFGIRATGAKAKLEPLPGSPYKTNVEPQAVALSKGKFAFCYPHGSSATNDIQALIRKSNGRLVAAAVSSSGLNNIGAGALDPSGKFLVLAGVALASGEVNCHAITSPKGDLTLRDQEPISPGGINAVVFASF